MPDQLYQKPVAETSAEMVSNNEMLEVLPKGVMHVPGAGINDNLANRARKHGIPVWNFGGA